MRSVKKTNGRLMILKRGLAILFLIGVCAFAFYQSPYYRRLLVRGQELYAAVMKRSFLVLGQANIVGRVRTRPEDINRVVSWTPGTPMMEISLTDIQSGLQELPWIKQAVVERHLPGTLYIRITEKEPIAVWQNNQEYFPLDEDGRPIPDDQTPLPNLLLVVGAGAPDQTPALLRALEQYPEIRQKVRSAVRVSQRRWNLILNDVENGVTVKLPETDIEAALERFARAIENEKILKKDLSMVDLRQNDRLTIRLKERKK